MSWKHRLKELGIILPEVATPAGSYLPAVRYDNMVYTSGQLPLVQGTLHIQGKVGEGASDLVGITEAYQAARICALNALAAIDALVGIDAIVRIIKVVGFVASAPGFNAQPQVINGASDILGEIFGEQGGHARSAVGVAELPRNTPVEVEIIVAIA